MAKKKLEISTKRMAISKANAQMVGIVGGAAFVTVFCLLASKSMLSQNQYQAKVTGVKEKAYRQLVQNTTAYESLRKEYVTFNSANPNIIGGALEGGGDNSGPNSQIILDALPSSYDFPALASSLEKILRENNLQASSISGTDDQLAQQTNLSSPTPAPVEIPFSLSIGGVSYDSAQKLVKVLDRSIRPIQIDKMTISGSATNMSISVDARTYYQPAKTLNIKKQVQK